MKKKLHNFNFLYFTLILLIMYSCEKEAKLDQAAVAQKLAVSCNFSPNEPFSIELSKTQSIFSGTIEDNIVDEAHVSISLDNQVIEEINGITTSINSGTKFESKLILPEAKKIYTLKVEVDGVEAIIATSEIPDAVEISHASVGEISLLSAYEVFEPVYQLIQPYDVRLSFQFSDPENQTDYYQISFYQELTLLDTVASATTPDTSKILKPLSEFTFIDESLTQNYNVTDGGILFKDTNFDGMNKEFLFEPRFELDRSIYAEPSNIIIELRSISKEYYNYYTSVYRQTSQANVPFSDPFIIFSNIENGYGVFAGYNKHQVKRTLVF